MINELEDILMDEKMKSGITSMTIDDRTYHNVTINPTLINFFYGKNGAGKSTIAEFIREKKGICPDISGYDVLVYDREFIKRNIKEDDDPEMPGVFSVSEGNIEKEEKIRKKEEELAALRESYKAANSDLTEAKNRPSEIRAAFDETCWDITKDIRKIMPKAMRRKSRDKTGFADELMKVKTPAKGKPDELKKLHDTAFGTDDTIYPRLKTADPIEPENIEGYDLLGTEVMSSADNPFADFIRTVGSMDWMLKGHESFSHAAGGRCPYCSGSLPTDFEEKVASCLDKEYEERKRKLISFRDAYVSAAEAAIYALRENTGSSFPKLDLTEYRNKLDTLSATFELNRKTIEDKITSPASKVVIEDVDGLIRDLNTLVGDFNKEIQDNNDIISSKKSKQQDCEDAVWAHMAYLVQGELAKYHTEDKTANDDIERLGNDVKRLAAEGRTLKDEIADLSSQIVSIDDTMNSINRKLIASGFQGFTLRKKSDEKGRYEIVRDDGSPARGLSEGERNFIAFLYFYHKVLGRESVDSVFRDRIVVIDDPVSSMDSSSLFIVSTIVRELISICHNNGRAVGKDEPRFIKQIFIMTHNAFFHKQVSHDRLKYFHCVNFYLIEKKGNVSTITPCRRKDPLSDEPAVEHNYSPVHNAYSALWKEYIDASSPVALRRIIHQILEYYFIQISGFEGQNLTERILKNENAFIRENPDGTENRNLLQSVDTLLHYVGSDTTGFNDGFNYIEGTEDADTIRETFECIFTAMDQRQHYLMMMDSVR